MAGLVLYKMDASPPASAVRALADMIDIQFEYKEPDFFNKEHKSPEYLKINPMGSLPTLQDEDLYISDSHAIMSYLLSKYGGDKRESLYPSDLRTRAIIDQCMFFDTGVFFIRLKVVMFSTLFGNQTEPSSKQRADIEDAFHIVEAYLGSHKYIACDHLTIADLAVGSTAAAIQCIHKLDETRFPRTAQWLKLLYTEPAIKKHIGTATKVLAYYYTSAQEKNKAL